MIKEIPSGVWPTMLTPFTETDKVDYNGLAALVDWYIEQGVDGLFAVCLSSEMYHLTLEERVEISKFVKEQSRGRVPVIASGHVSDVLDEQIIELQAMVDTGIDALVLVSNYLARQGEDDETWMRNAEKIMKAIPDIPLGIYECPVPYKRLMTPELLKWCVETGRFLFLKDTCCNLDQLKLKSKAVQGSRLKIFNANSATLLKSLKMDIAGFSGVMANFHPKLYAWLIRYWDTGPEKAAMLQNFLGLASFIEGQYYPVNAKYHMQLSGLPIELATRNKDVRGFTSLHRLQVKQLYDLAEKVFWANLS